MKKHFELMFVPLQAVRLTVKVLAPVVISWVVAEVAVRVMGEEDCAAMLCVDIVRVL